MALLLSDVQKNVQDFLWASVIDEFRKNNYLLDNMPFDDAISPTGGGATMTYTYNRVTTQPTAATRAINSEYTAQEAKKTRYSVDLKVFGGSFAIDRVLADMGGIQDEVTFQMQQKVKAAQALFSDMVINGDTTSDANGFNGLKKELTGTSMEVDASGIDLSTSANVTSNYTALLDLLDETISLMDGAPTAMLMSAKTKSLLRACARRAAMYQVTKDNWGQQVESYGATPMIDLGAKPGATTSIVTDGDIYFVRLALDGFHAVSTRGQSPIKTWLPDFNTAGAVKKGEVEMVAAVALKATKAAARLKGIKTVPTVTPPSGGSGGGGD